MLVQCGGAGQCLVQRVHLGGQGPRQGPDYPALPTVGSSRATSCRLEVVGPGRRSWRALLLRHCLCCGAGPVLLAGSPPCLGRQ